MLAVSILILRVNGHGLTKNSSAIVSRACFFFCLCELSSKEFVISYGLLSDCSEMNDIVLINVAIVVHYLSH